MANRGIPRALFKHGIRTSRMVLDGTGGLAFPPLHITPGEVPSATAVEGDVWFDDDNHTLGFHNGTAVREVASVPAGQGTIPNYRPHKVGATVLTSEDNGALCIWTAAAGYLFTLPAAQVGLWFDFEVRTTITSVGAKVLCASGDFLLGNFIQSTDVTYTSANHVANGTNIVSWNGDGSTTGGLAGDWLRVHALSASQWEVYGMGRATGSEATPFATS